MWVQPLGREDPLQEEMATHSSILAWRIPWTGGAWWATLDGVAKRRTRPKQLSTAPPRPGTCPLGADGSGNQFLGTISLWARWSYQ